MALDTLSRQVLQFMKVHECKLELEKVFHKEKTDIYSYVCENDICIGANDYKDVWIDVVWTNEKVEVWVQKTEETDGYSEGELVGSVNHLQFQLTGSVEPVSASQPNFHTHQVIM